MTTLPFGRLVLCLLLSASPLATLVARAQSVPLVVRGPYLQSATTSNILVRWRTDVPTETRVRYGATPTTLTSEAFDPAPTTEHQALLTGLSENTSYSYAVVAGGTVLVGGPAYAFTTSPAQGKPTRIWAIGDAGTASVGSMVPLAVRDSYLNFAGSRPTDLWLMLGDNAYFAGTDSEYQEAVFDVFQDLLRTTPLWPTVGNHDTYAATPDGHIAYTDIFSLPQDGRAGGVPSGSERYYSFDYGNIHFVCLDSESSLRSPGSPMLTWLDQDLSAHTKDWLIAFWHSPPYSKGVHDSDVETNLVDMRQYVVPILESYGVDLVLCGHSHSYERSYLLNGHYGLSGSLVSSMVLDPGDGQPETGGAYLKSASGPGGEQGAVYVVAGNAGHTEPGPLNHPAMLVSLKQLGSIVIDVNSNRLEAIFLRENGSVDDRFTILKGDQAPTILTQPSSVTVAEHETATFKVVATGTKPLSFQWLFSGTPLPGANSATLTLSDVQTSQAGTYSVVISNALGNVTSTEASLTVSLPPPCAAPASGLAAWWPLDGDGQDLVGGPAVVLIGGPVVEPGEVGQSLALDGVDDQMDAARSSTLDLGAGPGFTIELWINATSVTQPQPLLEWNNRAGSVGVQFWIATIGGPGSLFAGLGDGVGVSVASGAGVIQANTWQHVALSYDKASGMVRLYANGGEVKQEYVGPRTPLTTYDLFLGRRVAVSGSNYRYRGGLDEVSLYNRSLSGGEIRAIANAGKGGKCRVPTPPRIATGPSSQTVVQGRTAVFSVLLEGTMPLTYRWLFNGSPLPDATNSSLVLNNVQPAQAGRYSVIVSNAFGIATSDEAILTVGPAPTCLTPASGLVGWWPLEADGGDLIGGQHATLVGAPTFVPGKVTQALALDGADDQADVDASEILNVGVGAGFTIELWIKPASLEQQPLVEWNNRQGSVGVQFWISQLPPHGNGSGSLWANLADIHNTSHFVAGPANTLILNEWQHVALTYDKASGIVNLYVNGTQVTQANLGSMTVQTTYDLFFGRRVAVSGSNYRYTGGLDEISLYDRALSATEVLAIANADVAGKCEPLLAPRIASQPEGQSVVEGSTASFAVLAAGTQPLTYQWLFNGAPLSGATKSTLTLNNVQLTQAGRYAVVISNEVAVVTSSEATLTVTLAPPVIRAATVQAGGGGTVEVPLHLLANGEENALGFSVNFDRALLSFVSVELSADAPPNTAFIANQDQVGSGRLGLGIALPAGTAWARGTQELVRVRFTSSAVATPVTTALTFGDSPTTRQISDRDAKVVSGEFIEGSVTLLAADFEADAAPRPNGDRSLTIVDWVQVGRFVAGLDPISGPDAFQRADCAPRSLSGNGILAITDWVQAGRYATGLDPLTVAGGPTGEVPPPGFQAAAASSRVLRISDVLLRSGSTTNVSVRLEAQGDENAFGFSVTFDPAKLRFVKATAVGAAGAGGILNVNTYDLASGRVGVALALPATRVLAPGEQELVVLQFSVDAAAWGTTAIGFGDAPIYRELSDPLAEALPTTYSGAVLQLKSAGLVLSYNYNLSARSLMLFWSADDSTGFVLESSPALSGSPWTRVDVAPIAVGNQYLVTVAVPGGQVYYRLRKP